MSNLESYLSKKHSPEEVARRNDALDTRRNQVLNLIQQLEEGEKREATFDGIQTRIRELGDKDRNKDEQQELEDLFRARDAWEKQKSKTSLGDPNDFSSMSKTTI